MRRQVFSFLFFSTMSGLLAAMVLSVWMGMSHKMVTLSFSVTVSLFASSSAGCIAGTPSSRLNFIDGLLMAYKDSCRHGFGQSGGGCSASPEATYHLKTVTGRLVGKRQLYEPYTSFGSGQVQPVHVRFGVVHLVHSGQQLPSLCIKFGQLL